MTPTVTVTYYLQVLSSWCHWAEPAWSAIKARYGKKVRFEWKIASMNPEDFPATAAACDWFYRRSRTVMKSPYGLNSGWIEPGRRNGYPAPDLVVEAARSLGAVGDKVRLAVSRAAVREGRRMGNMDEAVEVAARAGKLSPTKLKAAAQSKAIAARVAASTADSHAYRIPNARLSSSRTPLATRPCSPAWFGLNR